MGWDGAGGYARQHNFSADASAGIKILALRMDQELDDIASAIPIALAKNGQNAPTANLPMGGFRHINVGAPTSVNNYMRSREFIENVPVFMTDAETSADRISVSAQYFTSVSANQAPGDGTGILIRVGSNKSSAALYLNGHSANVHYTDGGRIASALTSGGIYQFIYNSAAGFWKVQNPDTIETRLKYVRTAAEISAGVTPTKLWYEPGDVRRYGAVGDGVTNDTTAINAALSVNAPVFFPAGTYLASNLTQSHDFQRIEAVGGLVIIKKNANGVLFTSSGDDVQLVGIGFRGDAASPTFTGDNINASGDNFALINCGSRWTSGRALLSTGNHLQIIGQCDIYQTTATGSSDFDIEVGISGTATLYHQIQNIYTSQATGGIHFIDCGGQSVIGSQFGKLWVDAGTSPVGVNGGSYASNRINGDVTIDISGAVMISEAYSAITITLTAGTSGHFVSGSFNASCTIVDNSTNSTILDTRETGLHSYTPELTGAVSDPVIGDGTIIGRYTKRGKLVHCHVRIIWGTTSAAGSGEWRVSLPFTPATFGSQHGVLKILDSGTGHLVGVIETFSDGAAKARLITDGAANTVRDGVPITFANGDEIYGSIDYLTN